MIWQNILGRLGRSLHGRKGATLMRTSCYYLYALTLVSFLTAIPSVPSHAELRSPLSNAISAASGPSRCHLRGSPPERAHLACRMNRGLTRPIPSLRGGENSPQWSFTADAEQNETAGQNREGTPTGAWGTPPASLAMSSEEVYFSSTFVRIHLAVCVFF